MTRKIKARRRRESRARENLEKRKAERLTKQPESDNERDKSNQPERSLSNIVPLLSHPASSSQDEEEQAPSKEQKRENEMRILVAFWGVFKRCFLGVVGFLEKFDGAVTAVATIVIAFLTWKYVTVSQKQWEAMKAQTGIMQSQLTDFEDSQSARLVIEYKSEPCTDMQGDEIMCTGTFGITNSGPTAASIVMYGAGSAFGVGKMPNSFLEATAGPIPETKSSNGPWLPLGGRREVPAHVVGISKEALNKRTAYAYVNISVAYKDIFGHVIWVFDCYMYDPSDGGFRECPPATRIPPPGWTPAGASTQDNQKKK